MSAGFFFAAVQFMPLADALAVSFVYPFIVTALAGLVLGEQVGPWRWSAVVVGFVGIMIIIRPGFAAPSWGIPFALTAGTSFAMIILITRKLAGADPPALTLGATALVAAAIGSLALPFVWVTPAPADWSLMLLGGLVGTGCQLMLVMAYERASAAQLAPFAYVEVVSAAVIGLFLFGDWPDRVTWLGIAIVVASGVVIAWRESVRRKMGGELVRQ
jgi:drug/metabolite transporter (DMT)-like permease